MPYTYSYVYTKNDTAEITEETREIQNRPREKDLRYCNLETGNLEQVVNAYNGKPVMVVEYNKKGLISRVIGYYRDTGYISQINRYEYKYY